jgi:methionyl-tRNA formyltransferase
MPVERASGVLVFGDSYGVPQLLDALPGPIVRAIVGASIRPQDHAELSAMAAARHIPFLVQPRRDSPSYRTFVSAAGFGSPDLILVNSYSMRLPDEILAIAHNGAVNIHGGLLPKYRGSNPIQWAILNDERETGVSAHYMTGELDAGDLIAQRRVPLAFEDTWVTIRDRLARATAELLRDEIEGILSGNSPRVAQDPALAQHHRRRRPKDGMFEWDLPVRAIYNLIRALVSPHPGARYEADGKLHVIDSYRTIPEVAALKYAPGPGRRRLVVADGAFELDRAALAAQPSGNERVPFLLKVGSAIAGRLELQCDFQRGTATILSKLPASLGVVLLRDARDAAVSFAREELSLDASSGGDGR